MKKYQIVQQFIDSNLTVGTIIDNKDDMYVIQYKNTFGELKTIDASYDKIIKEWILNGNLKVLNLIDKQFNEFLTSE